MRRGWSDDRALDRGAALVETAFVLVIIVMLLVGMVSAGIAYNHQLALSHAAREAGRYAATLPITNFGSIDDWLEEIILQSLDDATGSLDPGTAGRYVCVAYVHPDASLPAPITTRRVLDTSGLNLAEPGQTCFADGRPNSERRVQIRVQREVLFNFVVAAPTVTIDSEGVSRFEAGLGF